MPVHLSLIEVEKYYREGSSRRTVLDRASARIERGTTLAVRGRSGSGKTTLLNLVAGLDLPDAGRIQVAGQDLHAMPDRQRTLFRRRHCGFVFQFFNLIPTLTVRENLRISLELNRLDSAVHRQRPDALLARAGLAARADSFPDQLSGGEAQRVALLRALAHEPGLLLADEPTGNLDAAAELTMLALMRDLGRARGTTVIIATHSDLVASHADRILHIDAGVLRDS